MYLTKNIFHEYLICSSYVKGILQLVVLTVFILVYLCHVYTHAGVQVRVRTHTHIYIFLVNCFYSGTGFAEVVK